MSLATNLQVELSLLALIPKLYKTYMSLNTFWLQFILKLYYIPPNQSILLLHIVLFKMLIDLGEYNINKWGFV